MKKKKPTQSPSQLEKTQTQNLLKILWVNLGLMIFCIILARGSTLNWLESYNKAQLAYPQVTFFKSP